MMEQIDQVVLVEISGPGQGSDCADLLVVAIVGEREEVVAAQDPLERFDRTRFSLSIDWNACLARRGHEFEQLTGDLDVSRSTGPKGEQPLLCLMNGSVFQKPRHVLRKQSRISGLKPQSLQHPAHRQLRL